MKNLYTYYYYSTLVILVTTTLLVAGRPAAAEMRECIRWTIDANTEQTGCCIVPEGTTFSSYTGWAKELYGSWQKCLGNGPRGGPHCSGIGWAWWIGEPWMESAGVGFKSKICWRVYNEKHDRRRQVAFDVDMNYPAGANLVKPSLSKERKGNGWVRPNKAKTKTKSLIAK